MLLLNAKREGSTSSVQKSGAAGLYSTSRSNIVQILVLVLFLVLFLRVLEIFLGFKICGGWSGRGIAVP